MSLEQQHEASDPRFSAWVEASAGAGKTKILTDRVLRLLLAGVPPERILCLTFTKAAAAEMAMRITSRLSAWSLASDAALCDDLLRLSGKRAKKNVLERARGLFALVVDSAEKLQVVTIHGFCQSLLRRFPLEAKLSPQFDVIDDTIAKEYLKTARDLIIRKAISEQNGPFANAFVEIAETINEDELSNLLEEIIGEQYRFREIFEGPANEKTLGNIIRAQLNINSLEIELKIIEGISSYDSKTLAELEKAVAILMSGNQSDRALSNAIKNWLQNEKPNRASFENYKLGFLTQKGSIRTRLASVKIFNEHPSLEQTLTSEASRLTAVDDKLKCLDLVSKNEKLAFLSQSVMQLYTENKKNNSVIDYDDLITLANTLIANDEISPWILYKLDGGIDHLLLDEAQDTNSDQWKIVETLVKEFFTEQNGIGNLGSRTLFVVGDPKQSIFSFQGADPNLFKMKQQTLKESFELAKKPWKDVKLDVSYRSSAAVLEAVDTVFEPESSEFSSIKHHPFRSGQAGLVEIWPPEEPVDRKPRDFWSVPRKQIHFDEPSTRLASKIASKISSWIKSGEILKSRGRAIEPCDIIILLRQRSHFMEELVNALKQKLVPVAGVDRMILTDQLAVMDLMAFGKFVLLPEDDLNLANLLKSPFLEIDEDDLLELCWDRGDSTLWETLNNKSALNSKFSETLDQLKCWLERAHRLSPFELYSDLLSMGGRRKLLERIGAEAGDPIDQFLAQILEYDRTNVPTLQGFVNWLSNGNHEIKRDMEADGSNKVRIMTVHGAKGLQAPIVFMPDTISKPSQSPKIVWSERSSNQQFPLWSPNRLGNPQIIETLREVELEIREKEYLRLLYVAMTRAEDRLYIGGWGTLPKDEDSTWYGKLKNRLKPIARDADGVLQISLDQVSGPDRKDIRPIRKKDILQLPEWLWEDPKELTFETDRLIPSAPNELSNNLSLFAPEKTDKFLRGRIIHSLLQILPNIPTEKRWNLAKKYLLGEYPKLDNEQKDEYITTALKVINFPCLSEIFSENAFVEAPLNGTVKENGIDREVRARVDRLVVSDKEVIIADFKTDKRPPKKFDDIEETYQKQMNLYYKLIKKIYPKHIIRCMLIWTEGPKIIKFPGQYFSQS